MFMFFFSFFFLIGPPGSPGQSGRYYDERTGGGGGGGGGETERIVPGAVTFQNTEAMAKVSIYMPNCISSKPYLDVILVSVFFFFN